MRHGTEPKDRFVRFSSDHPISVKMYAEVIGDLSLAVRELLISRKVAWPQWDPHDGKKGPALHLYLSGTRLESAADGPKIISFDLAELDSFFDAANALLGEDGLSEGQQLSRNTIFFKVQFRKKIDAEAVSFRPTDEVPLVESFRLPYARGREYGVFQSRLFVDRMPGAEFTNYKGESGQVWRGFDPVYLKVKNAEGEEYVAKAWTEWFEDSVYVKFQVAGAAELLRDELTLLRNYVFEVRVNERDDFEKGAEITRRGPRSFQSR